MSTEIEWGVRHEFGMSTGNGGSWGQPQPPYQVVKDEARARMIAKRDWAALGRRDVVDGVPGEWVEVSAYD